MPHIWRTCFTFRSSSSPPSLPQPHQVASASSVSRVRDRNSSEAEEYPLVPPTGKQRACEKTGASCLKAPRPHPRRAAHVTQRRGWVSGSGTGDKRREKACELCEWGAEASRGRGYKLGLKGAGLVPWGVWRVGRWRVLRGAGGGGVTKHSGEGLEGLSAGTGQTPSGRRRELFMPSHIGGGNKQTNKPRIIFCSTGIPVVQGCLYYKAGPL